MKIRFHGAADGTDAGAAVGVTGGVTGGITDGITNSITDGTKDDIADGITGGMTGVMTGGITGGTIDSIAGAMTGGTADGLTVSRELVDIDEQTVLPHGGLYQGWNLHRERNCVAPRPLLSAGTGVLSQAHHGQWEPLHAAAAQPVGLSGHAGIAEPLARTRQLRHPPRQTWVVHGNRVAACSRRCGIRHELGLPLRAPACGETLTV